MHDECIDMGSSIPIRVILDGENETVLTGSIHIIPVVNQAPSTAASNSSATEEEYDYQGAMLFSVLVISVYALSIVLLIASFIKKKQVLVSVEESKNVNQYLIQVSDLKEKTARENFKKLKRSIIEAVEKSNSQRPTSSAVNDNSRKNGDKTAFKNAILGAGLSLYSPLVMIKEEKDPDDDCHVVSVHTDASSLSASSPSAYPFSPSLSPESPGTSDHRPLLNISGNNSPDVWQALTPDTPMLPGYRNASFQSPSPQTPRRMKSDVWVPISMRTRTPSPHRTSQDNAVSSV